MGALVAVRAAVGCAVGALVRTVAAVGGLPSCVPDAGCGAVASLEGAVAVSGAGATADAALVVGDDVCAPAIAAPALDDLSSAPAAAAHRVRLTGTQQQEGQHACKVR